MQSWTAWIQSKTILELGIAYALILFEKTGDIKMTWVIGIICFLIGYVVGHAIRGLAFEYQDWQVLKWSKDSFGYRPQPPSSRIFRGDKLAMAVQVDTSEFPDEGIIVE